MDLDVLKVKPKAVQKALLRVLEKAPHRSRSRKSLVGRIASELGFRSVRGSRRKALEKKVEQALEVLKRPKRKEPAEVEEYRTPKRNVRIRLIIR